jgi:hypothetical protein
MDYYAGLDVSMNETHICVVERDGCVVLEAKASSTPEAIAAVLETAPACERIVLEISRMAPMLFHGLTAANVALNCHATRCARPREHCDHFSSGAPRYANAPGLRAGSMPS